MAAFDQTDTIRRFQLQSIIEEMFYPWAGGIHQTFGTPGKDFTRICVFGFNHPQSIFTIGASDLSASANFTTAHHHFLRV